MLPRDLTTKFSLESNIPENVTLTATTNKPTAMQIYEILHLPVLCEADPVQLQCAEENVCRQVHLAADPWGQRKDAKKNSKLSGLPCTPVFPRDVCFQSFELDKEEKCTSNIDTGSSSSGSKYFRSETPLAPRVRPRENAKAFQLIGDVSANGIYTPRSVVRVLDVSSMAHQQDLLEQGLSGRPALHRPQFNAANIWTRIYDIAVVLSPPSSRSNYDVIPTKRRLSPS